MFRHIIVEMQNSTDILEISLIISYKVKHLLFDPGIPALDIYPKEMKYMFIKQQQQQQKFVWESLLQCLLLVIAQN